MPDKPSLISSGLQFLQGLRFPQLFMILGAVFLADLFVPDFVPMADEIILGLLTLMLGAWKREREERPAAGAATGVPAGGTIKEAEKNITPEL